MAAYQYIIETLKITVSSKGKVQIIENKIALTTGIINLKTLLLALLATQIKKPIQHNMLNRENKITAKLTLLY